MVRKDSEVQIDVEGVKLPGILDLPVPNKPIIVFVHGSGSSRFSPRNSYVAGVLRDSGFGTLLFDLLTPEEDTTYETRFDIDLLTERLLSTTSWLATGTQTKGYKVGYFGASTGAAAALRAATTVGSEAVSAVVSRGGRPDLAGSHYLTKVNVPTLLIVGGHDEEVLELNKTALKQIASNSKELVVIPNATHLFEEPGTLEEVAKVATRWFEGHL